MRRDALLSRPAAPGFASGLNGRLTSQTGETEAEYVFRQHCFSDVLPGALDAAYLSDSSATPFMHERYHALGMNAHLAQLDVLDGRAGRGCPE